MNLSIRNLVAAFVIPLALAACAADATDTAAAEDTNDVVRESGTVELQPQRGTVTPFCPEGEKRSCTLGPPPVCSCIAIVRASRL